ncbi:peptidoglycan-binding protein [Streptacidiphilus sp. EB129]|uniref:peptidoglycan-binding protein n=1 Tax=Streptacidiphilus sp. EB129 TaxID=3156262 RepID=UPI003512506D
MPEGLDPTVVQYVAQLRRLKDESRLSLKQLALRTGYSTSSWERYLGGRVLPPRGAAEALAELVGVDPVRLVARYEAAAEAWQSEAADRERKQGREPGQDPGTGVTEVRGDTSPEQPRGIGSGSAEAPPPPGVGPWSGQRLRTALIALVAALAGAGITLLAVQPARQVAAGPAAHPIAPVASQVSYLCTYARRGGLWYAGNSTTTTELVEVDMYGPVVAELQCLLQRAGISPGGIDGAFGPLTEAAVIQAQKKYHLDVDGQVGPHTWAALRG